MTFPIISYIFLIAQKTWYPRCFKIQKAEVENQLEKQIKIIRSGREGEFYEGYDEDDQVIGPFASYLQDCEIAAQFKMPSIPEQNGMTERRNKTLVW